MKSKATTVAAYLKSLPPDRRAAIEQVRRVILDHLDAGIEECMQYGAIGYCVSHKVWPHGHHTRPELPLMYMGLSSQKNDMVVYMLCLYQNEPMREWFDKAWKATGKKLHLEVSGAGCCVRFTKVEDLALDVIGETMRRMTVRKYLKHRVAMLERMGKGPEGKTSKKTARKTSVKRGSMGKKTTRVGKNAKPAAKKIGRAAR